MELYHQDCPAALGGAGTNRSRWWQRAFFIGRRKGRGIARLMERPRDGAYSCLMKTYECEACGTSVHVDF